MWKSVKMKVFLSKFGNWDFSQLRISRRTPLPSLPQKWPYLQERCAQCWIEWKVNFQIFIFWVMADCIKKIVQKWPNLQERCAKIWNLINFCLCFWSVHVWWIVNTISHNSKILIAKIRKLIFHLIQHCAHLSCIYGNFWKGGGLHFFIRPFDM